MAAKHLLPGFGGRQTITLLVNDDSDIFDLSLCEAFAVQMTAETGSTSVQIEQSFDGVNWVALGAAITVVGTTQKYDITDKPHGLIRLNGTGAGGTGSVMTLVGFAAAVPK
jgi:hypothetical protein